jgi:hypothetical protein
VVGNAENGRSRVPVNGDTSVRGLHASCVLEGTTDARGQV